MNIQNKYSKITHIKMYKYYVKMYMHKWEKGRKKGIIGKRGRGKREGGAVASCYRGQIQSSKTY